MHILKSLLGCNIGFFGVFFALILANIVPSLDIKDASLPASFHIPTRGYILPISVQ